MEQESRTAQAAARAIWIIAHWKIAVVVIVILALALFGILILAAASNNSGGGPNSDSPCIPDTLDPPVAVDPPSDVRAEQINNAKTIDEVAADLGLSGKASRIGIITAFGESTLINVEYGDKAGPDSRGLFQQRPTMDWGTYEQVMDPKYAARSFFLGHGTNKGLTDIQNWEAMEPTFAIHAVQNNKDPLHYAKFYTDADAIIQEAQIDVNRLPDAERQEQNNVKKDSEKEDFQVDEQCIPTEQDKQDNGKSDPDAQQYNGEGGNDDYPWSGNVPPGGVYVADPMGFYYGECTSWAGWVINRNAGSTKAPFKYSYAKGNFVNGNAKEWKSRWLARGWKVSSKPVAGAVAWWDAYSGGAGWAGHVATVKEVLPDGRVIIEEYNRTPPGQHQYGIRKPQAADQVDAYLYPPE
ncbi:CHAP domain-containing protein [Glutamicibacter arilaitensis]|uniref:CHAP domain-containing protein n=1 Tax=Glutamicibacter arilaitensis TaxID=256701 RepID=UPI003F8E9F8D